MKQADVEVHLNGLRNVLRHPLLKLWNTEISSALYTVKGIFFCDIQVGDAITKDQIVGHMEDYFGDVLVDIKAPVDGKRREIA